MWLLWPTKGLRKAPGCRSFIILCASLGVGWPLWLTVTWMIWPFGLIQWSLLPDCGTPCRHVHYWPKNSQHITEFREELLAQWCRTYFYAGQLRSNPCQLGLGRTPISIVGWLESGYILQYWNFRGHYGITYLVWFFTCQPSRHFTNQSSWPGDMFMFWVSSAQNASLKHKKPTALRLGTTCGETVSKWRHRSQEDAPISSSNRVSSICVISKLNLGNAAGNI